MGFFILCGIYYSMKIIITESQYKILSEQKSNVYTDQVQYEKALKKYNDVMYGYKEMLKAYEFFKNANNKIPVATSKTPFIVKQGSICGHSFGYCESNYIVDYERKMSNRNSDMYKITKMMEHYKSPKEYDVTFSFVGQDSMGNDFKFYQVKEISKGESCNYGNRGGICIRIYKKPTLKKPIYKPVTTTTPDIKPKSIVDKKEQKIQYEEMKSNSSFAPWLPTGTPIVKVGTYYLTYPEFEDYKKKNSSKLFIKK